MGKKLTKREKIKLRVRSSIVGKTPLPRLSVYKSNKTTYCQIHDDLSGTTVASASSKGMSGTKIEQAAAVGKLVAEQAKTINVSKVVFDRSGYVYHGRVKALADGAREGGLEF